MIRCLDIHTHKPAPQPYGVVNADFKDFTPMEGQIYSVGIHPWDTQNLPSNEEWAKLETVARMPEIVAIGECGVDKAKGGLLYKQMIVLNRQVDLSEKIAKPLILHDVKAHDIVVGLRREKPYTQNWVIHGFRGKPTVAKMLTDAGIYLSFGEKFNPESLKMVPEHLILAETDESSLDIQSIITNISEAMGRDMLPAIADNTLRFLRS